MNRTHRFVAATALLVLAGASAQADTIYGSAALLTARDCSNVTAVQDCIPNAVHGNPVVPRVFTSYLGGVGASLNTSVTNTHGTYQVGTGANPGGLPVLKGGSWSGSNSRINTNAVVFQQFTYLGADSTPFSLVGNLDFDYSGNDGLDEAGEVGSGGAHGEQAGEASLFAQMYLMSASAFAGVSSAEDVMQLLGRGCGDAGIGAQVSFSASGLPAGHHDTQLKLDKNCAGEDMFLSTGSTFVVVMALQTPSNRGGFSDATHTFSSAFDPSLKPEELAKLQQFVLPGSPRDLPEPAALGLLLLAAAAAGGGRRFRR